MKIPVQSRLPVLAGIFLAMLAPRAILAQGCPVADGDFVRTQLVKPADINEPMQLAVDEDDNVYWIERASGNLFIYNKNGITKAATIPCTKGQGNSVGVIGMALAPDFKTSRHIYLNYSPTGKSVLRVSRFTLNGTTLDLASEKMIIEWESAFDGKHYGGALSFGPGNMLFISVGDNYGNSGTDFTSSFGTSLNPNVDNGKILRVIPKPEGGCDFPPDNLFKAGQGKPEIYVMGNRNPYRIAADPRTGWLYWGEVGSDGPRMEEFNQAREAGNYGWPAVFGDNEHTPGWGGYAAIAAQRPPLKPGLINYNNASDKVYTSPTATTSMNIRGTAAMGGPVYYYNGQSPSLHKFPPKYHGTLWTFEFDARWIKPVSFTDEGYVKSIDAFPSYSWNHMIDMKFSPAGELYVLDYGSTYRINNNNDGLYKISYNPSNPATCLPRMAELDGKTIGNVATRTVPHGRAATPRADFVRRIDGRAFIDLAALGTVLEGEAAVLSLDGREMARVSLQGGRKLVPISAVPPGLYFVRLKTSQGYREQKTLL
jgi:cytochrome c